MKATKAGTSKGEIIDRLEEACDVWRRTPDKERSYLKAGERVCWPTIILSYYESGLYAAVKVRRPPPLPASIDRADEVMNWLTWLGKTHGREVMRALWLCHGEGKEVSTVSRSMGLSRPTVRKKRDFGLAVLVLHVAGVKKAA